MNEELRNKYLSGDAARTHIRGMIARARLLRRKRLLRWMTMQRMAILALATSVVLVLTLDAWLLTCGFSGCPSGEAIRAWRPTEGGRVLDRRGALLGQMEAVRRENVPLAMVPQHVRDAFLITEDRRFYEHHGLDWRAVARAMRRNIMSLSFAEGFSTITMQLARNSFISAGNVNNMLGRKLLELRYARLLERELSKDEILELYLNAIYLGDGVFGVQGASRDIFGKPVDKLSVAEGALLAGLPKAPSVYNPRNDVVRAKGRRDLVLSLMAKSGAIDSVALRQAQKSPIRVAPAQWANGKSEPSALTPVRALVDSVLHSLGRDGQEVIVRTTLDVAAQRAADSAVTRRAAVIQRETNAYYRKPQPDIQGAMIALDPLGGGILAIVGSAKYERGGYNRAYHAHRQPGSAFKPFVYAAAMAKGITPASLIEDEPVSVRAQGKNWTPANYGGEYFGTITVRNALAKSANAATVRVSREVGEANVVKVAKQNGITSELLAVPAIALGALEVTPLELVAAYVPFANGGFRVTPHLITSIESRDGEVLWLRPIAPAVSAQVMDIRDAFLVTSMLRSVVDEGTGTAVRGYGVNGVVAGKTGTSNDATDLWFVGYSPTIVAGFWFGFDTPRMISAGANGGRHAAPAWAEFYRNGWRERDPWRGWPVPPGMVQRVIDSETGELAMDWCPEVREEWFKAGTEPTRFCETHVYDESGWIGRIGRDIGRAIGNVFGTRRAGTVTIDTTGSGRRRGTVTVDTAELRRRATRPPPE